MSDKKKLSAEEIRQGHIDRFIQGEDAWNKWAREMLREKEALQKAEKWLIILEYDGEFSSIRRVSPNPDTQYLLDRTAVNFSLIKFETKNSLKGDIIDEKTKLIIVEGDKINFSGFIFPGEVYFDEVIFNDKATFEGALFSEYTRFYRAVFNGDAEFDNVEFECNASFFRTAFNSAVYFDSTVFSGDVNFYKADCVDGASFVRVQFSEKAFFNNVTFSGDSHFFFSAFKGDAWFDSVIFTGNALFYDASFESIAIFRQTSFNKFTNFANSKFHSNALFSALHCERGFTLANSQFIHQIPDFTQAHVKEAPRLDNVKIFHTPRYYNLKRLLHLTKEIGKTPQGRFKQPIWYLKQQLPGMNFRFWAGLRLKQMWDTLKNHSRDKDEEAHYRALKRLAIQAHDHENEMKFFAGEIRARRHVQDYALPWKNGLGSSFRYWTGLGYDLISDFGRSLWRPLLLWALLFCLFSSLYLSNATELAGDTCKNSNDMTPRYAANAIAAKNALLFLGADRTDKIKRAYACLYGAEPLYSKASDGGPDPRQKMGYDKLPNAQKHLAPNVPSAVSILGILHSILSLSLIFLLLLAIRNQFKIK